MTASALRHIGNALEFYRRQLAKNGHPADAELAALARHFIALGSGREVTEGHRGSLFAPLPAGAHSEDMTEQLLTRAAAADYLGISVSTLKRREHDGIVTPLRHGRVVRYRLTDLTSHMEAGPTC